MRDIRAVALLVVLMAAATAAGAAACVPQRLPVTVGLADFESPAEIVMPPKGSVAHGAALLFAGSDVADMDGAISGKDGTIIARPMRQVADRLACAGVASLRYNKRYVTGSTTVDREKFGQLTGNDLAADGRAALAFLKAQRALAGLPVVLIGWSEGTTVAMAVSAAETSVRAIVLMAPVVDASATVAQQQYPRIGRPYLMRYATDGALDARAIAKAQAGSGGILAQIFVRMFKGFRPDERVNPLLDVNHDGRISFNEADPIIASWYADTPDSGLGMSASVRALPNVASAFGPRTPPLLIMQGMNDSMIDPSSAIAFAHQAGVSERVTLKTYARLGHSLGTADSAIDDELRPVAYRPLEDLAAWVNSMLAKVPMGQASLEQ